MIKAIKKIICSLRSAFMLVAVGTLILGVAYPLMVTAMAQILFNSKSGGSLIRGDTLAGSELLGQSFEHSKYFWSRPSATTPPYNATASSGSNMNPANPRLLEVVNARIAALQQADPDNKAPIPVDLVTASASGLDPHISLAAAQYQLPRVARVRHTSVEAVAAVMEKYTYRPILPIFGEPYVVVVLLNKALDEQ